MAEMCIVDIQRVSRILNDTFFVRYEVTNSNGVTEQLRTHVIAKDEIDAYQKVLSRWK